MIQDLNSVNFRHRFRVRLRTGAHSTTHTSQVQRSTKYIRILTIRQGSDHSSTSGHPHQVVQGVITTQPNHIIPLLYALVLPTPHALDPLYNSQLCRSPIPRFSHDISSAGVRCSRLSPTVNPASSCNPHANAYPFNRRPSRLQPPFCL